MDWARQLQKTLQREPCVLVTMNLILGSAPRESGCRMIVTATQAIGSIGGGNLEFTATQKSRDMLQESTAARQIHQPFGLGPALNQCCGGAVTLLFEVLSGDCPGWLMDLAAERKPESPRVLIMAIDRTEPLRFTIEGPDSPQTPIPVSVWEAAQNLINSQPDIGTVNESLEAIREIEAGNEKWWLERIRPEQPALMLFGAGHVGQEVARLLERLPFAVQWIDNRPDVFPSTLASNIHAINSPDPVQEVADALPGSIFVVMTHSHELDEDICFEILQRDGFCWLGLIGSDTKRRRFVQRLNKRGIPEEMLDRLSCPIGLIGIHGKQPATIALSLVAQLMMEKPWNHANN